MIPEVDDALRGLIRDALDGAEAEVVFDAPTTDWAARRNAPTINMYLYDLREDLRQRTRGVVQRRNPEGTVAQRLAPPRYFRLSYLVTAWTQRPEDEHRLLDAVLAHLVGLEVLPPESVEAVTRRSGGQVAVHVGLPPPEDRGFADVWSALGGELKPSIDVVVVAPIVPAEDLTVGPPVLEPLVVGSTDLVSGATDPPRQRHQAPPAREPADLAPVGKPRARKRRS